MASIKIIAVPPGQAPEWVREAWIGLTIPLSSTITADGLQTGIFRGKPENVGGYMVSGQAAVDVLKSNNAEAADWWFENAPLALLGSLVFKKDVCELIE